MGRDGGISRILKKKIYWDGGLFFEMEWRRWIMIFGCGEICLDGDEKGCLDGG
jgi:hypothetical protein